MGFSPQYPGMGLARLLLPLPVLLLGCAHSANVASSSVASGSVGRAPMSISSPCADLAECTLACDAGDPNACVSAADAWENFTRKRIELLVRIPAYARACRDGSPLGCFKLGGEYLEKHYLPVNFGRAADLMRAICDTDSRRCIEAAVLLRSEEGPEELVQTFANPAWTTIRAKCGSTDIADVRECLTGIVYLKEANMEVPPSSSEVERARNTLVDTCRAGSARACLDAAYWSASQALPGGDPMRSDAIAVDAGRALANGCTSETKTGDCTLPHPRDLVRAYGLNGFEDLKRLHGTALRVACEAGHAQSCAAVTYADRVEACYAKPPNPTACLELGQEDEKFARDTPAEKARVLERAANNYESACSGENQEGCARLSKLRSSQ